MRYARSLRFVAAALIIMGCSSDDKAPLAPQFATTTTDPTVKSVSPTSSQKGVTLDITVNGSGYDRGTRIDLGLAGVPSPYVHTNSTTYVNSRQLIANVTISLDAATGSYDVIATTTTGKKGIGAELFGVEDPHVTWYVPLDASLSVQSDGKYSDGTSSLYKHGVCGVDARIFATPEASDGGDAIGQSDNPKLKDRKCADYPRKLKLVYEDGFTEAGSFFINLHQIESTTYTIPVGETVLRSLNVRAGSRCGTLRFREYKLDGTYLGADDVLVTRVAPDTWDVVSQAAPNDLAYCDSDGKLYHMQVRLRVKSWLVDLP